MDIEALYSRLLEISNKKQVDYTSNVIPESKLILGVKLPELRKIAKEIAKKDYKDFLDNCPDTYFEYEILQAFVIGYAKDDIEVLLEYADRFIPKIHDWAVNDGFCQSFKIAKKYRDIVWEWLQKYIDSDKEYEQRVAAVLLMSHFLVDDYIDRVLDTMNKLQCEGYYTRMGVAWCVATAYATYPKETMKYMHNNKLQDWTYNKSIQKMIESYRVSDEDKKVLRTMKRK